MKRIGFSIGLLAVLFLVLPSLPAQDAKKDGVDAEKKDEETKKPEPKKGPEKLVYAYKFITKIMSTDANSNRDIKIEIKEIDPKKVAEVQTWQAQQMQQFNRTVYDISMERNPQQRINRMQNYQKSLYDFQVESAKRAQNIYKTKPMEVRGVEDVKVRTLVLPVEYDDQGFQKKWTKKELDERRDKTGLPGLPADLDALKQGQVVEIYMAKSAAAVKEPMKKKGADAPTAAERPEFVMIVIMQDGGK